MCLNVTCKWAELALVETNGVGVYDIEIFERKTVEELPTICIHVICLLQYAVI